MIIVMFTGQSGHTHKIKQNTAKTLKTKKEHINQQKSTHKPYDCTYFNLDVHFLKKYYIFLFLFKDKYIIGSLTV